jgi:hypothetical protein
MEREFEVVVEGSRDHNLSQCVEPYLPYLIPEGPNLLKIASPQFFRTTTSKPAIGTSWCRISCSCTPSSRRSFNGSADSGTAGRRGRSYSQLSFRDLGWRGDEVRDGSSFDLRLDMSTKKETRAVSGRKRFRITESDLRDEVTQIEPCSRCLPNSDLLPVTRASLKPHV